MYAIIKKSLVQIEIGILCTTEHGSRIGLYMKITTNLNNTRMFKLPATSQIGVADASLKELSLPAYLQGHEYPPWYFL